jgi:2-keto-4-pentenoate hydratase/2-oxohepta-3-ene-1,7-dioic acid hydratase in catechol pathway
MKLLRAGNTGKETPAALHSDGSLRDISSVIVDLAGENLSDRSLARLRKIDLSKMPELSSSTRIGPCVGGTGKFICIGLNYSDHAAESNMAIPTEPIVFLKATSAIIGPNDNVMLPKDSLKTDWEVELGVVIGKLARHTPIDDALEHVAGYCVVNDVSERSFQLERGGQWDKGKGCDTFGPIGPWLVTRDEIPNPQNLSMWLDVDGERQQTGSTSTMIFSVAALISYCSCFMTLHPGDVISTGTPPGVGMGKKPIPRYLRAGQVMELGIENLGAQRQVAIPFE